MPVTRSGVFIADLSGLLFNDEKSQKYIVDQRVDNFIQCIKCISWSTCYLLGSDLSTG